jgi:hypothetical protein
MSVTFIDLLRNQFEYGGVKYASTNAGKEATDELVEDFGWNWLIGTQAKYVKRYRNMTLEKDLLKIGCYQYINWLKRGYHLSPGGTAEMKCTTVATKTEFFPVFVEKLRRYNEESVRGCEREGYLARIYELLMDLRVNIAEESFLEICSLCSSLWVLDGWDKQEEHKTDTWRKGDTGNGTKV